MDTPKYQHLFDTDHFRDQLKAKSVRGGFNTMAGEFVVFVLRIVSMIILARLLMPEHFGLITMVASITVFAERFKDLGLSTVTVQRREITHGQVSNLFWINAATGVAITIIMAALSKLIAWFYGDVRLVPITLALSTCFLFGGLTVQHQALLRRQMRFGHLAANQVISWLLSVIIAIVLASRGFGYWALVWKEVLRTVLNAAGVWILCRWLPGLPVRHCGTGSMVRFGRDITGFNLIYFFSRGVDKILIGKFWGAGPLGLYRQASQFISEPIYHLRFPVGYVAEPLLSSLQEDPDKYCQYYRRILSLLSFALMPVIVYLAVFSDVLVRGLLGEKWIKAVPIFRMFAVAGFMEPFVSTCGFVMITLGKTVRFFYWGVITGLCTVVAYCVGVRWGPIGVSAAYAVYIYVTLVPFLRFCFKDTPVTMSLFFGAISLPLISSLLMGLALMLIAPQISTLNRFAEIPVSFVSAFIIYCGIWMLFPGGSQRLREYFSYPLLLFKSGSASPVDGKES